MLKVFATLVRGTNMFQKTCKTFGFMEIIVCINSSRRGWGGAKQFLPMAYYKSPLRLDRYRPIKPIVCRFYVLTWALFPTFANPDNGSCLLLQILQHMILSFSLSAFKRRKDCCFMRINFILPQCHMLLKGEKAAVS